MRRVLQALLYLSSVFLLLPAVSSAANLVLQNGSIVATFNDGGLRAVKDTRSGASATFDADRWRLSLDSTELRSTEAVPRVNKTSPEEITYNYSLAGYQVEVVYQLRPGWHFVTKQLKLLNAPRTDFVVRQVQPVDVTLVDPISSAYVPSNYEPQIGQTIEETRSRLPGKDYGAFLRLPQSYGLMLVVQNPFLKVNQQGQSASIEYAPEMPWKASWGVFSSDIACIGPYRLSGKKLPREMLLEWKLPHATADDGMDLAEVDAFTDCVRAFLVDPSPSPISVEVGWTLNDYQIDVGTEEGEAEYKRVFDTTSDLGIQTLLYAPGNSKLSDRSKSTDSWNWEYVLWLGLGEKIRDGSWNPDKDVIPKSVTDMIAYAKAKHVGLLAYVYPSVPYSHDSSWLVKPEEGQDKLTYATLASRKFQDYLIHNLEVFQKRTGIAGYSFDYTWLNLPGSSSYAQWYGWRRVMESLRRASPHIIIDGRQSYQMYGPWSWLAGSYPHPTGTDEQPESFTPYPDLHFDRVSADRARFVNYWYRNYQFAPPELIPGYATHQTERSMDVSTDAQTGGDREGAKMMYTNFRRRDWDFLGYRYSFISSIATGGWNNVVDMIPARDPEEDKHFSAADKIWIRDWINWTVKNKEYIKHTRSILQQPAMDHVDGTSMIIGDRGYIFLFNPNCRALPAEFHLDGTIGVTQGKEFMLREIYPQTGRVIGKPQAGIWNRGDKVELPLDGTSATVLELVPSAVNQEAVIMNAAASEGLPKPVAALAGDTLTLTHVSGEPGTRQQIGVLLPEGVQVRKMTVNRRAVLLTQDGRFVSTEIHFAGVRFAHSEQLNLARAADGSLEGTFVVPQRIFAQLAARKKAWPIPWTSEDYQTTWLAPERLLLFVQIAEPKDSMEVSATLDGQSLPLTHAYSSVRVHGASFVGFYADLSKITPDTRHSFTIKLPQLQPGQFQGVFFDNVEPQFTEEVAR